MRRGRRRRTGKRASSGPRPWSGRLLPRCRSSLMVSLLAFRRTWRSRSRPRLPRNLLNPRPLQLCLSLLVLIVAVLDHLLRSRRQWTHLHPFWLLKRSLSIQSPRRTCRQNAKLLLLRKKLLPRPTDLVADGQLFLLRERPQLLAEARIKLLRSTTVKNRRTLILNLTQQSRLRSWLLIQLTHRRQPLERLRSSHAFGSLSPACPGALL
mmetsp:Transcript_85403/g.227726  ORF Transcript_85403/g.227726 Transcript_85403/m.227726 type:complete len:209 (-) Transcript_85403:68-694(-)